MDRQKYQQTYLPGEMQFYISVMFLGLPDDIHEEKPSFLQSKKRITDRRTDGRTDRPSHRDARTHLKITEKKLKKNYLRTKIINLQFLCDKNKS